MALYLPNFKFHYDNSHLQIMPYISTSCSPFLTSLLPLIEMSEIFIFNRQYMGTWSQLEVLAWPALWWVFSKYNNGQNMDKGQWNTETSNPYIPWNISPLEKFLQQRREMSERLEEWVLNSNLTVFSRSSRFANFILPIFFRFNTFPLHIILFLNHQFNFVFMSFMTKESIQTDNHRCLICRWLEPDMRAFYTFLEYLSVWLDCEIIVHH